MKILILTQKFSTRLAERVQLLEKEGAQVFLICFELNNRFISKSFVFFSKPTNTLSTFFLAVKLIRYFRWCTVVHWHGTDIESSGLCLFFQKVFRKKGIIEFRKNDVFIPEIEFSDNPEYRRKWFDIEKKASGSFNSSIGIQKHFSKNHFIPLTDVAVSQFLLPDFFPPPYQLLQTILLFDDPLAAEARHTNGDKIIIAVNMLTDHIDDELAVLLGRIKKTWGDRIVINEMKSALIVDVTYAILNCDIWMGSTINGHYSHWDWYAMAKGKAVLTYVKPYFARRFYKSLPFIVTGETSIENTVRNFVEDRKLLEDIKSENSVYFNANFEKQKSILDLIEFYKKAVG